MDDVQIIKDKIDVVELIREYIELKPAGVNQKGLCPFHGEKTPSFMTSGERQSWHCFGCNKGGDIFTFVQEIEGMDFVEALKFLAAKAGVELTTKSFEKSGGKKDRIKQINTVAASFFHNVLTKMDVSKPARVYLHDRGLFDQTIEEWNIGFIPDQWDLLTKYLLKKGHSIDDLVDSGLTIKRDGADRESGRGYYDRFRGRIMFPISDVHGSVVGFTGRVLIETEKSGGKYVNTPQTLVYDKSRVIFGLHNARQSIRKKDFIVMVEGQMDVISSHQAGVTNVVASSGTALTEQQVILLKRYSENIKVAFDSDDAGQKAAKRGIDIALEKGMRVQVICIPENAGKDPDDCIRKDPKSWIKAIEEAKDIMDWYVDKAFAMRDIKKPSEKQAIVETILPEIVLIPYAVERDHWLHVIANKLGIPTDVLRDDFKRVQAIGRTKKIETTIIDVVEEKPKNINVLRQKDRVNSLEDRLFALFIKFHHLFDGVWWKGLEVVLSTGDYSELYENIKEQYNKTGLFDVELFNASKEFKEIFNISIMQSDLLFDEFSESMATMEMKNVITRLRNEWIKKTRIQLQHDMEEAERTGDSVKAQKLLEQFQTLI